MKSSKLLICFTAAMFCSVAMADSLKFKFLPGDKYSLASVTELKMLRVMDGNEKNTEVTTRLDCDLEIEEVDESGIAWAKYIYKHAAMKIRSEDLKVDFDSDANQLKIPMSAMPLRQAVGESVYLRITPQGRIEKINGLQALVTYAKAKLGNFNGVEVVSQNISRQFDEPSVRHDLEDLLAVFPDSNSEGATWSRREVFSSEDADAALMGQIEEVNLVGEKTFRLNSEKTGRGGIAVVDVNFIVKPASVAVVSTSASDMASAAPSKATREISGTGLGQIEIEEATGRIINSKMTQDTVETIKFTAPSEMLRPPPSPEPVVTHTVTTFQMTKITDGKPIQPADANDKGSPSAPPGVN